MALNSQEPTLAERKSSVACENQKKVGRDYTMLVLLKDKTKLLTFCFNKLAVG